MNTPTSPQRTVGPVLPYDDALPPGSGSRRWSARLAVTLIPMTILSLLTLAVGYAMVGGGDGDSTVFGVGVVFCFLTWLVLVASVTLGIVAWARSKRVVWWVIPGLLFLLALTAVGLWGIQG